MVYKEDISDLEVGKLDIDFRVAKTEEDQLGRLGVVTDRYRTEGYLDDIESFLTGEKISDLLASSGEEILKRDLDEDKYNKFIEHGLLVKTEANEEYYLDKYTWNSVPFVAKRGEEYLGSARIIIRNGHGLPTYSDSRIEVTPEWRDKIKDCKAEFSQFAIKKGSPSGVSIGLLRAAHIYSRDELKIKYWIATIDDRVVRLLNSSFFYFGLPQMGPGVNYLGSLSIPVLVDFEDALSSAEEHESSKKMARFIRGGKTEGFEWYTGI